MYIVSRSILVSKILTQNLIRFSIKTPLYVAQIQTYISIYRCPLSIGKASLNANKQITTIIIAIKSV